MKDFYLSWRIIYSFLREKIIFLSGGFLLPDFSWVTLKIWWTLK